MKRLLVILAICVVSQAAPNLRRLRGPLGGPKGVEADRSSRIYQADGNADPMQFPFHAYILTSSRYLFGGALISENFVLTSAQATTGYLSWEVKLGMTVASADEEWVQTQSTRSVYTHPNFILNGQDNIGLIEIVPVAVTVYVAPVMLPRQSDASDTFEGRSTIATGFGQTGDNTVTSDFLRYTRMAVLSNSDCDIQFGFPLTEMDLCAVGVGNTCPGDNGGPLVIEELPTEKYTVIGVIAFGAPSCESGLPSGFTRVTSYLSWIETVTGIEIIP